jgi:Gpi18-like mannosyltransferase
VTTPQADGADRATVSGSPLREAVSGLAIVLLVGLLLRLTIAYVLLPGSGFKSDIATFTAWAVQLANHGPGTFYATASFADYPPGYLYILWLIGALGQFLAPFANGDAASATTALVKLPAIFADVAVGYLLFRVLRGWLQPRRDASRLALIAAAIYLFNPVTWYDSAIWGQTDAVGALVTLLTVAALVRGNSEGSSVLAVLAALIKPQFGILLLPVVGIVLVRRHLWRPGSGPRHEVLLRDRLPSIGRWLATEQGPLRLVSSALISFAVLLLLIVPFSLDIGGFINLMENTAGGYQYLSVNAYNPWALIGSNGQMPLAFGGGWSPDTVPLLGPLPGVVIGAALLLVGFAVGVVRAFWSDDRRSIVIVTTFLALAFFILPTRVHERYMFPIFALLPLLAVVDRRWLWATVALSIGAFINLHGILTIDIYGSPNVLSLPFGDLFRSSFGVVTAAALSVAGFAFVAWQMRPAAIEEPDPFAASTPPGGGSFDEELSDEEYVVPEQPGSGVWHRVTQFAGMVSVRRDRSASLVGETGGRLDRRDLALMLLFFLAALVLRTYRLEVPYGPHFDEVYHARTAKEFLQDWQYGMPHSIYEYTHPHLAKYAMAVGIMVLGDNRVTSMADLGAPVVAAATETRWSPPDQPDQRDGDRVYVVTPDEVRAYDLATQQMVATIPGNYSAVAVDQDAHVLFLADAGGQVWQLPTAELDLIRSDAQAPAQLAPSPLAQLTGLSGDLDRLSVAGGRLIAVSAGGTLVSLDPGSALVTGRTTLTSPAALVEVPAHALVVVDPAQVSDTATLAARLGTIIGVNQETIRAELDAATGPVAVTGYADAYLDSLQSGIDDGELPGVSIQQGSGVAVATASGIAILDASSLGQLDFITNQTPVTGIDLMASGLDQPTIYAAAGKQLITVKLPSDSAPMAGETVPMPNTVTQVYWNPATTMIHALGVTQDGSAPTIYVVEPRGNSVYADARLDAQPVAVALDVQPQRPAQDRDNLLAFTANGQLMTVDIGSNQFAYRFPGVLGGALLSLLLYLLTRFLFRRRSVAVIVSLLVLADGMFFANSRIAMNDIYVAVFIVAAFAVFVPLWLGRWRRSWQIVVGLLLVGVLLGLALASKWVGLYALGAVALLILLRSALGRFVALVLMILMTGLLGYIAITPNPAVINPQINYPFLGLMILLTGLLAAAMVLRPVRFTMDELRFLVAGPIVVGLPILAYGLYGLVSSPAAVAGTFTPTRLAYVGGGLIVFGLACLGGAWLAGRTGRGPLARVPRAVADPAAPPPPSGWLRPGSGFLGLPWLLGLGVIVVVPLVVYVISYIPWINLGNQWFTGYPPGHTGQTFLDLQVAMYDYHDYLRATHPASSPWWAWPLDLKPVWFAQFDYANSTTAVIYDTGNVVIFWLSIPAVAWATWQAWQRRSLALTFIAIAIMALWLPWARIDRATFQYHFFTVLPFSFLALAYFLAELWHGPSPPTWLLARASAALAIIGAPLLWLLRLPLCGLARTEQVNAGTEVCGALSRNLTLTDIQVVGLLLAVGGLALAGALFYGRLLAHAAVPSEGGDGRSAGASQRQPRGLSAMLLPGLFGLALLGVTIVILGAGLPGTPVFQATVLAEEPAFIALILLAVPAYFVLRAVDPRRFVIGVLVAAVVWFVVFYPNIANLPVPTPLSQIHLGLLPTWNWGFQFGVNLDEPNRAAPDPGGVLMLIVAVTGVCIVAAYAAHAWVVDRGRDHEFSRLSGGR